MFPVPIYFLLYKKKDYYIYISGKNRGGKSKSGTKKDLSSTTHR